MRKFVGILAMLYSIILATGIGMLASCSYRNGDVYGALIGGAIASGCLALTSTIAILLKGVKE